MNQEKIWDTIADSWHHLRQKQFQPVKDFQERYKIQGKILEIGCGNARNLIPLAQKNIECHGVDFSQKMITKAESYTKKHNVKIYLKKADMRKLPYKNEYFNYVLHIASLHHLESEQELLQALNEAKRILKKNGLILLTVWNKLQLKFLLKRRHTFIPWRVKGTEHKRYYHLFDYLELKSLIKKTRLKVLESNIFGKNLVFILKKC